MAGSYKNSRKLLGQQTLLAERNSQSVQAEVVRNVRNAWYSYLLNRETLKVLIYQDSVYSKFVEKAEIRWKTGETSKLELISATTKFQEVKALKESAEMELKNSEAVLKQLLNVTDPIVIAESSLFVTIEKDILNVELSTNAQTNIEMQNIAVAGARLAVEKSKSLPDFSFGYSQQLIVSGFNPANISRTYSPGTRIAGFQIGVAVPVFNHAGRARVKAEKIAVEVAKSNYERLQSQVALAYTQELEHYATFKKQVDYYLNAGIKLADEQSRIAQVSFNLGEIGYLEYIQHIAGSVQVKLAYLETLSQLNQSAIQLQYLKGN